MLRELACRSSLKLATCVGAPIGDVGACGRMLKRTRGGSLPSSCGEKAAKRARTAQGKAPPQPADCAREFVLLPRGWLQQRRPPCRPSNEGCATRRICMQRYPLLQGARRARARRGAHAGGRASRKKDQGRRTCMTCPEGHSTASPGSVVQLQGVARASETLPPPPTPPVGRTDHASAQPAARHATNASAEAEQPRRPRPPSMARAAR